MNGLNNAHSGRDVTAGEAGEPHSVDHSMTRDETLAYIVDTLDGLRLISSHKVGSELEATLYAARDTAQRLLNDDDET
jgi:hypothetical protein